MISWSSQIQLDKYIISSIILISIIVVGGFLGGIGSLKEKKRLSVIGGIICLCAVGFYRFFIEYLGAWRGVDIWLIMGGAFMILDRYIDRSFLTDRLRPIIPGGKKSMEDKSKDPFEKYIEKLNIIDNELEKLWKDPSKTQELKRKLLQAKEVRSSFISSANSNPILLEQIRQQLYKSESAQTLLSIFLSLKEPGLKPQVEGGNIIYKPADTSLNVSSLYVVEQLERLAEPKILLKQFDNKILACPKCDYFSDIRVHYKCQKCASMDIEMIKLSEHLACGTVHEKSRYIKADKNICPQCNAEISLDTLKIVGVTFQCNSCNETFSDPLEFVYCKKCKGEFSLKEAEFTNSYTYLANPDFKEEIITSMYTSTLALILKDSGFKIQESSLIKGKADLPLNFTLIANKKDETYAIEILHSDKGIKLQDILPSVAKFDDVGYAKPFIIALPQIDDEARNFLESKRISHIASANLDDVKMQFKVLIES